MKIVLGSDHAGFQLKETVAKYLRSLGHKAVDVGTSSTKAVDYPDYAEEVAITLLDGGAKRGILLCGSGVGASVAVRAEIHLRRCESGAGARRFSSVGRA